MTALVKMTSRGLRAHQERILEIETLSSSSPWGLNAFEAETTNPFSRFWGVTGQGTLRGYICFWRCDRAYELLNIAVHPEARRRGLGKRLLKCMLEQGVAEGIKKVWLEVRPSNRIARGLYQRMGFTEVGRRLRYYRNPDEDAIIMASETSTQPDAPCLSSAPLSPLSNTGG
jgi:ribosomal-protein-alanine N-acetyltransferase